MSAAGLFIPIEIHAVHSWSNYSGDGQTELLPAAVLEGGEGWGEGWRLPPAKKSVLWPPWKQQDIGKRGRWLWLRGAKWLANGGPGSPAGAKNNPSDPNCRKRSRVAASPALCSTTFDLAEKNNNNVRLTRRFFRRSWNCPGDGSEQLSCATCSRWKKSGWFVESQFAGKS